MTDKEQVKRILAWAVEACQTESQARLKCFFKLGNLCVSLANMNAPKFLKKAYGREGLTRGDAADKVMNHCLEQAKVLNFSPPPTTRSYWYGAMKAAEILSEQQQEILLQSGTSWSNVLKLCCKPKEEMLDYLKEAEETKQPIRMERADSYTRMRETIKHLKRGSKQNGASEIIDRGVEWNNQNSERDSVKIILDPMESEEAMVCKMAMLFSRVGINILQEAGNRAGLNISKKNTQFAALRAS